MEEQPAAQAVADWAKEGEQSAPPAWEELPGIPLYMDQVILYLGESLRLFHLFCLVTYAGIYLPEINSC